MIDPKLNRLPIDSMGEFKDTPAALLSEEEKAESLRRSRAGLSINDTIARDASLSVGAAGVDTSGVSAGAGVGAGMTNLTPGEPGESPAPKLVPGARGSGTTVASTSTLEENPAREIDLGSETFKASHEEIAGRAYVCWHARGCPDGSPEVDWEQARRQLEDERRARRSFAASA